MSFAEELSAYKSTASKEVIAEAATEAVKAVEVRLEPGSAPIETPAPVEAVSPEPPKHGEAYDGRLDANFDSGLPTDAKAKAQPETAKAPEVKVEAAKPAPIKIGNEEFQTIEEAVEFAKKLERAAAEDKAYAEGVEAERKKAEVAKAQEPIESIEEKVEKKLFENPKEALKEYKEAILQQIRDEYNKSLRDTQAVQQAEQAKAQAWDTFYKENTDLSAPEVREIAEKFLLPKWTQEKKLLPTTSQKEFAEMVRKHLKITKESTAPKKELQREPVVMASASGEATQVATAKKDEESSMDFVTAMQRIRARGKR